MTTRLLAPVLALALLVVAAPDASAQQEDRPHRGKIDQVEDEASGDGNTPVFIRIIWESGRLLYHMATFSGGVKGPGQGYTDYPYADPRAVEHFVLRGVDAHRGFGALGGSAFSDAGSTLTGVRVTWEQARGAVAYDAEVDALREPTASEVDHLTLVRFGLSGLTRVSHAVLYRRGLGLRLMVLDDGRPALGPELTLGIQAFPLRPLAFDGTFRVAGLSGAGASWFGTALVEGSAGAGVLFGRIELRAGLRGVVIGHSTTLGGPTFGARIWF